MATRSSRCRACGGHANGALPCPRAAGTPIGSMPARGSVTVADTAVKVGDKVRHKPEGLPTMQAMVETVLQAAPTGMRPISSLATAIQKGWWPTAPQVHISSTVWAHEPTRPSGKVEISTSCQSERTVMPVRAKHHATVTTGKAMTQEEHTRATASLEGHGQAQHGTQRPA